ncbi:MAG: hypothetical protein ACTHU0_30615 [Kofleriaceae bacterium]
MIAGIGARIGGEISAREPAGSGASFAHEPAASGASFARELSAATHERRMQGPAESTPRDRSTSRARDERRDDDHTRSLERRDDARSLRRRDDGHARSLGRRDDDHARSLQRRDDDHARSLQRANDRRLDQDRARAVERADDPRAPRPEDERAHSSETADVESRRHRDLDDDDEPSKTSKHADARGHRTAATDRALAVENTDRSATNRALAAEKADARGDRSVTDRALELTRGVAASATSSTIYASALDARGQTSVQSAEISAKLDDSDPADNQALSYATSTTTSHPPSWRPGASGSPDAPTAPQLSRVHVALGAAAPTAPAAPVAPSSEPSPTAPLTPLEQAVHDLLSQLPSPATDDDDDRAGAPLDLLPTAAPFAPWATVEDASATPTAAAPIRDPDAAPDLPTTAAPSHLRMVVGEGDDQIVVQVAVRGADVQVSLRGGDDATTSALARNAGALDHAMRARGLDLARFSAERDPTDRRREPDRDPSPRECAPDAPAFALEETP